MKEYPSIPSLDQMSRRLQTKLNKGPWCGFDKLDGSGIRAEWSSKRGFYKFGTRHHLIDVSTPLYGEATELILDNYKPLTWFLQGALVERAIAFFEFFGEHSFAGSHTEETHQVRLIDLDFYKKGLVDPKTLQSLEDVVPCAHFLFYEDMPNEDLLREIETSTLAGMTFEGVVFKRGAGHERVSFKYKSRAWLDKLAEVCKGDLNRFEALR